MIYISLISAVIFLIDISSAGSYLMCHVCGCPSSAQPNEIFFENCTGNCKDKSDYGKILPCPTGACHSLSLESEITNNNVTYRKNCFDKVPSVYLEKKNRTMGRCYSFEFMAVKTEECLCDKNFCNSSFGLQFSSVSQLLPLLTVLLISKCDIRF